MVILTKKAVFLVSVLTVAGSLFAQNEVEYKQEPKPAVEEEFSSQERLTELFASIQAKERTANSFLDFVEKKAYAANVDEDEERRKIREEWKELLRMDIFFPYFKAKEAEDWVSEKVSVKVLKIRGRPKLEDNQIKYIFKVKF